MVVPTVPPERARRDVPSVDHLREPHSYFAVAFVTIIILAFAAMLVLANAQRIDTTEAAPIAVLPNRCEAPAAQGDRLVVMFTHRGHVIDIVCRPIKGLKS